MMEKENLTNRIDEDLERRNRNWDKIDKLKEDLEEEVGELRDDLAEHKLDYVEHLNLDMPHRFENKAKNKTYKFGFQVSDGGSPQIIYEEVM